MGGDWGTPGVGPFVGVHVKESQKFEKHSLPERFLDIALKKDLTGVKKCILSLFASSKPPANEL